MTLAIEYAEPSALNPAPYNPRRIDDENLKRLAALLDAHGFVDPVIARREDGLLIGGHQRLKANALRKTPDETIPVVYLEGVTDAKAKALNVALNNPGAQGVWDMPQLANLLVEIDTGDFDVPEFTAFSEDEIEDMMTYVPDENKAIDEEAMSETEHECPKCGFQW